MTDSLKKIAWSVFEPVSPFALDELTCSDFPFEGAVINGIESLSEEHVLVLQNCAIVRVVLANLIAEELTTSTVHESWLDAMAAQFGEESLQKPKKTLDNLTEIQRAARNREDGERQVAKATRPPDSQSESF